jgi:hypothetical protein
LADAGGLNSASRKKVFGGGNRMARIGAAVAAGLSLALALGGCGSTSNSSLFNSSPLDLFKSSPKLTTGGGAGSNTAVIDTEYDCPEVKVRAGAATLMIGSKPGEGEPSALDVRYQGSITRTARECHLNAGIMTMKVGIEGRIITGPAGGPGSVEVPMRIAVVHEGLADPRTVVSKLGRETVTLTGTVDRATFTHIDSDISFPLPTPVTDISTYIVYVGFDPQRAQPEKKPTVRKRKSRPAAKPRSS